MFKMRKSIFGLLGFICISGILSSEVNAADWMPFEGHAVKGNGTGAKRLLYKKTDAQDKEEFIGICQDMCASGEADGKNGPCGGFVVNYKNKKKNKPKYCAFKKTDSKPYAKKAKDAYLIVASEYDMNDTTEEERRIEEEEAIRERMRTEDERMRSEEEERVRAEEERISN